MTKYAEIKNIGRRKLTVFGAFSFITFISLVKILIKQVVPIEIANQMRVILCYLAVPEI